MFGQSAAPEESHPTDVRAHWDRRYLERESMWSGKVNASLADAVVDIEANLGRDRPQAGAPRQSGGTDSGASDGARGRALDIGCGEGADALWLAARGWEVTGVDVSAVAIERARARAVADGLDGHVSFIAADLETWEPDARFDLITASFFQSHLGLDRAGIIERLARRLTPGGHLVTISHAAPPPWSDAAKQHGHDHADTPTVESEQAIASRVPGLGVLSADVRTRPAIGPDGEAVELDDLVFIARRTG